MNDPWFDIRDDLGDPSDWEPEEWIQLPETEVRALLADADALLELARSVLPLREVLLLPWQHDRLTQEERLILDAHNMLPEHLRNG